jgi:putative ABC transport system permease protein
VEQTYLFISILLWITGLTSLAISGVGVENTMTAAMMEQTPDIGLWKALGATNREVMLLIASQAAVIGLMGGIWGTLAGLLGVYLFNSLGGMNMTIQVWGQDMTQGMLAQSPAWLLLASPVFSLVVGLLAGITPAMRAAALSPVNILKDE